MAGGLGRTVLRRSGGLLLAALCAVGCGPAQALPAGSPPISRFTPDLDVFPQNFDVAQGPGAVIYVANADGVLSFDGERWQLIPLPNADTARALAYDRAGRVYVGGFDALGYLERDAGGADQYHDLLPRFESLLQGESFTDVWTVTVTAQGVFFKAARHLFQYRPDSGAVQLWRHDGRFGAVVEHAGEVIVQFRGEGLKRLVDGRWMPLPGGDALREHVYELVPLPDGGLLTLARDGRWQVLREGRVQPYAMPQDFPPSSFFAEALQLADGALAFVADDGALYFFDPQRREAQRVPLEADSLAGIDLAADGGLLSVDDLAVIHVSSPSTWTVFGPAQGLTGALHGIERYRDRWLALSGAGVYELAEDPAGARFRRLPWTDHEAWDLVELEDGSALLAESYVVKLIRNGRATAITGGSFYPRLLQRSRLDPDLVYVGSDLGLAILQREGPRWRLRLDVDSGSSLRINSLVELSATELWAGTERDGVRLLRLSDDRTRVVESRAFGAAEGIGYGRVAAASVLRLPDGALIASTGAGLFRWEDGRFVRTELDGLEALRGLNEWLTLALAPNGDSWAFSYKSVLQRSGQGPWERQEIGSFRRGGLESIAFERSGVALLGGSGSILRFDPARRDPAGAAPRLALRALERLEPDGRRTLLPLDGRTPLRIAEGSFALAFRLALPEYRRPDAARYQAQLVGEEDQPNDWSGGSSYTYTRLGPGEYRFEARATDATGAESAIEPLDLVIEPLWYNTLWARLALALLVAGAIAGASLGAIRVRTRLLRVEKLRLERVVAERTRELQSANRQLEAMAHLDGLTEVPNRRRLDDYLAEIWRQCAQQDRPLAVLAIDVDYFKSYNDRHGHLAGDDMLKKIVRVLSHGLRRAEDLVARFGGDEFLVVMPGAEPALAREVAETMRRQVEEAQVGTTVSIGVAARRPRTGEDVAALVGEADAALYQAKHSGRNRVAAAPAPVAA